MNESLERRTDRALDLNDPQVRAEFEKRVRQIREELKPLTNPIRESAELTAADYSVTINSPPVEEYRK